MEKAGFVKAGNFVADENYSTWLKSIKCNTIRYQVGNELKNSMPEKLAYIPWRHHFDILRRCKNIEEALFYIDETISNGWSRPLPRLQTSWPRQCQNHPNICQDCRRE